MARKSYAKLTHSIRLDGDVVKELQQRAMAEQTTVGALMRRAIDNYLADRDASEAVVEMEGRIIASISRAISQLDRHQLQTRRAADISVAQGELLRGLLMAGLFVRQDGESREQMIARTRDEFMRGLPKALAATGEVMQMIRASMEPALRSEKAVDDLPDEDGIEEPSAEAAAVGAV
jgi:hypothetical protein